MAVTGADAARVEAALAGLPRLRAVHAEGWAEGMAASLRAGIAALPAEATAAVVFLGDMPRVDGASAARLLAALEGGAEAAAFRHAGRPAHPAAFARTLFPELLALTGDEGARHLLRRPNTVHLDTADPGAAFDVDRPSDLP